MTRPFKCRRIKANPQVTYFKPRAIPVSILEEVNLTMDEFESIRLADLEGMYQAEAASKMKVSRQTFGNIINSAHKKIADAIINAKAIKIKGGVYKMPNQNQKKFKCRECKHDWEIPYGSGRPNECPSCKSQDIHRDPADRGWSRKSGDFCGRGKGRCGGQKQ